MNNFEKNFWLSSKAKEVFSISNAEQKTIQPTIAELINRFAPKTLLDYGCGDSFISNLVTPSIAWALYDLNYEISRETFERIKLTRSCEVYKNPDEIPSETYDCVLFSLVLVCINSIDEYRRILNNIQKYKKKDGKLIFVTTHPCFRQHEFRPFYTSYSKENSFDYFNELAPFELYLREDDNNTTVNFIDYHWTLASTINELIKSGFIITEMIEVPDKTFDHIKANKHFPPFIILICE